MVDGAEDVVDGVPFGEVEGAPTEDDVVEEVDAWGIMDKAMEGMAVDVVEDERIPFVPEVIGGAQVNGADRVAVARRRMLQRRRGGHHG